MDCPSCGYENAPPEARYCPNCTAALPQGHEPRVQATVTQDVGQVAGGKVTGLEVGQVVGDLVANFYASDAAAEGVRNRRNQLILLAKVRDFWVEGVLERSPHSAALIDLGKEVPAQAVTDHPWDTVVSLPEQAPYALPPGRKIVDIFDAAGGALLILGEPGSGKTTSLLELARDTIARAERDPGQPIPVVLNLSSWAAGRESIADWVVDELNVKYLIPKPIGRPWVEDNGLLLLLDGLDEVRAEHRDACVGALNQFRAEYGLTGMVVCSRTQEYEALPTRLKLHGAIVLQPLTLDQVSAYLDRFGPELAALRQAIATTPDLQELARRPLTLSVMTLVYQGPAGAELVAAPADLPERRRRLFAAYVAKMFDRRARTQAELYPQAQTIDWLAWLARGMTDHGESLFLIEQLQPSWLPTRRQRTLYTLGSRLIVGLMIGLVLGLMGALAWGLAAGLVLGLGAGLVGGLALGVVDQSRFEHGRLWALVGHAPGRWQNAIYLLIYGLIGLLFFGFLGVLSVGLIVGPVLGLVIGLLWRVRSIRRTPSNDIQPVETLSWSWAEARHGGRRGLAIGLTVGLAWGLLGGFLFGLAVGLEDGMGSGLLWGLGGGLIFGVIIGLIGALLGLPVGGALGGLRHAVAEMKTAPNQGIRLSLRNAARGALLFALVFGLLLAVLFALIGTLVAGWLGGGGVGLNLVASVGLIGGLVVGLLAGLWYGGLDVIQHYTLRLILQRAGYIPRDLGQFLDYAADRILLQKVGGGYIFIHRMLLEYFAGL